MDANLINGGKPGRGRPRAFDPDAALEVGQRMFHAAGYDAVGLSALTDALGIKAPSFYSAFGSKAAFFRQVLERYASSALALTDILLPGRPPAEALADLVGRAARTYAADPERPGCLVLEAARGGEASESAQLACEVAEWRRAQVRVFVAATHPEQAGIATDYVSAVMSGLSAGARQGWDAARLCAVAEVSAAGLVRLLP
ncbi:MAG: TetR/AcrR family transcriptional regulator [Burkholderia sp.]